MVLSFSPLRYVEGEKKEENVCVYVSIYTFFYVNVFVYVAEVIEVVTRCVLEFQSSEVRGEQEEEEIYVRVSIYIYLSMSMSVCMLQLQALRYVYLMSMSMSISKAMSSSMSMSVSESVLLR